MRDAPCRIVHCTVSGSCSCSRSVRRNAQRRNGHNRQHRHDCRNHAHTLSLRHAHRHRAHRKRHRASGRGRRCSPRHISWSQPWNHCTRCSPRIPPPCQTRQNHHNPHPRRFSHSPWRRPHRHNPSNSHGPHHRHDHPSSTSSHRDWRLCNRSIRHRKHSQSPSTVAVATIPQLPVLGSSPTPTFGSLPKLPHQLLQQPARPPTCPPPAFQWVLPAHRALRLLAQRPALRVQPCHPLPKPVDRLL